MAFTLKRQTAKVVHLNMREEKHGEESVLAVDVKLKVDVRNDFLDALGTGLRAALYRADEEQLAGIEVPLSILRFPQLRPLDWEAAMPTVDLTLHGAKKTEDLDFRGSITKALQLASKEGGTVEVTLQVQVHPEPGQMEHLSALLGRSTKISVKAADVLPDEALDSGSEPGILSSAPAPAHRAKPAKRRPGKKRATEAWPFADAR